MKMLTKITSLVLAVTMILLVLPVLPIQAADATKAKLTYIKGDSNRDRELNEADLNEYFNIVKGTAAAPSAEELSKISIVSDTSLTMEDVRRIARVVNGKAEASSLYKSQQELQQYVDAFFADLSTEIGKADDELKDDYLQDYYNTAKIQGTDKQEAYLSQYVNVYSDTVKTVAGDKTAYFDTLYTNVTAETGELREAGIQAYFNTLGEVITTETGDKTAYLQKFYENANKETGDMKTAQLQNYLTALTTVVNAGTTAEKVTYLPLLTEFIDSTSGTQMHSALATYFSTLAALIRASKDKAVKDGYIDIYYNTIIAKGGTAKAAYLDTYFGVLSEVVDASADKISYLGRLAALIDNTAGDSMYAVLTYYLGTLNTVINASKTQADKNAYLTQYYKTVVSKSGNKLTDYLTQYGSVFTEAVKATTGDKSAYFDTLYTNVTAETGDLRTAGIQIYFNALGEIIKAETGDKAAYLNKFYENANKEANDIKAAQLQNYLNILTAIIDASDAANKVAYLPRLAAFVEDTSGTLMESALTYYITLLTGLIQTSTDKAVKDGYIDTYYNVVIAKGGTNKAAYLDTYFGVLKGVVDTATDKASYLDRLTSLIGNTTGDSMYEIITYYLGIIAELTNAGATVEEKDARLTEYFTFVNNNGADKKADYFQSYFELLKGVIEAPNVIKSNYFDELVLLLANTTGTLKTAVLDYYLAIINEYIGASEDKTEEDKYLDLYLAAVNEYSGTSKSDYLQKYYDILKAIVDSQTIADIITYMPNLKNLADSASGAQQIAFVAYKNSVLTKYINGFGDMVKAITDDKTPYFDTLYDNVSIETGDLRTAGINAYFNALGDVIKAETVDKTGYLSKFYENANKETGDMKTAQLQNYLNVLTAIIDACEAADKGTYVPQLTAFIEDTSGTLMESALTYYFTILTGFIQASTDKAVKDGYIDTYYNTIIAKGGTNKAAYLDTYFGVLKGVVNASTDKASYLGKLSALIDNTTGDSMYAVITYNLGIIAGLINAGTTVTTKDAHLAEYFELVKNKGADKKADYFRSYFELLKGVINASTDKASYFDRLAALIDNTTGDLMHEVISYNLGIITELFNAAANQADKDARLAEYFELVKNKGADKKADYFGDYFILLKSVIEAPSANKPDYYDELALLLDNITGTFKTTVFEYYIALINDSFTTSENDADKQKYAKLYVDIINKHGDKLTFFNDLVNVIKTDEFKKDNQISYFLRTTTSTETKNFTFAGLKEDQLGEIKKLYDEEMDGSSVEYSALREDFHILNSNMPCFNESYISALTSSDVSSVNIEYGVDCKILADGGYGDTYTRTATDKTYDVVRYKQTIPNTIKVTVNLKQETKASLEALPTAENGGKTILMKGYGNDAREILAEFPHSETETVESLLTMTMNMKCNNLTTDCAIEYYFDSVTLEPIAAHYTTKIVSYQHVDIAVDLLIGLNLINPDITGSFDPTSTSVYDYYYFFDGSYPASVTE